METFNSPVKIKTRKQIMNSSQPRLIPLSEWPKHHIWPSIRGLRHLVFHASKNGFDKVICRCGRRVLINEAAFFEWALNSNKNQ